MGSKSAGPGGQMGGMGDVPAFDMPPTQQVPFYPAQQQGPEINPNILAAIMGQQQMPPTAGPAMMSRPPTAGPAMMPPQMTRPAVMPPRPPTAGPAMMPPQMTGGIRQPQINGLFPGGPPTRVPVNGDGQPVRPPFMGPRMNPFMGPRMNPFMGNLGGDNYPMPQRAPIERPMLPPEVVDALRLAMQGQTQRPMGQTPMGVMPMLQGRLRTQPFDPYSPAAQSEAAEISRQMGLSPNHPRVQDELRLRRGLPVY